MSVCAVIVTYNDRFHLLSEVVNTLWEESVDIIVIINNGATDDSAEQICDLQKKNPSKIISYNYEENQGTAIAFGKGIEIACRAYCDYVWILDDDNKPKKGSLQELKLFWQTLSKPGKEYSTALTSLRKDRINYINALDKKQPFAILPPKNNFAGFHVKTLFNKLFSKIQPHHSDEKSWRPQKIVAAAYGGLFFNKKLIDAIGLPNKDFVLYQDDFDFTYRITLGKGDIWLIPSSIVEDIEASYYLQPNKPFLFHSGFDAKTDATAYYMFRNIHFFSSNFPIDNKATFYLNKWLFWLFIGFIGVLKNNFHRLRILKEAIKDAEKKSLGINAKYKLSE